MQPIKAMRLRSNTPLAPTPSDPYFANVSALLHMDDVAGQAFLDVTGKTWTVAGTPGGITGAEKVFGAGGGDLTSAGYYFGTPSHADFDFGTGDFTIQWWQKWPALSGYATAYNYGYTNAGGILVQSGNGDGKYNLYLSYASVGAAICSESTAASAGVWHFYEVNRSGTTVTIRRDGVVTATGTSALNIASVTNLVFGYAPSVPNYPILAYIDDLRITKGICRNDAVPVAAFPDHA